MGVAKQPIDKQEDYYGGNYSSAQLPRNQSGQAAARRSFPLGCSLCSVKLGLRFTQPRLNEVRVCVAIVMRSDQLRLDDDAVDNFPNSLDCPCKLFGADLQVIARNVSAEHRRSACDFHINGKSAEIGITH